MRQSMPISGPAKPHAAPPIAPDVHDDGRPHGYAVAGGGPDIAYIPTRAIEGLTDVTADHALPAVFTLRRREYLRNMEAYLAVIELPWTHVRGHDHRAMRVETGWFPEVLDPRVAGSAAGYPTQYDDPADKITMQQCHWPQTMAAWGHLAEHEGPAPDWEGPPRPDQLREVHDDLLQWAWHAQRAQANIYLRIREAVIHELPLLGCSAGDELRAGLLSGHEDAFLAQAIHAGWFSCHEPHGNARLGLLPIGSILAATAFSLHVHITLPPYHAPSRPIEVTAPAATPPRQRPYDARVGQPWGVDGGAPPAPLGQRAHAAPRPQGTAPQRAEFVPSGEGQGSGAQRAGAVPRHQGAAPQRAEYVPSGVPGRDARATGGAAAAVPSEAPGYGAPQRAEYMHGGPSDRGTAGGWGQPAAEGVWRPSGAAGHAEPYAPPGLGPQPRPGGGRGQAKRGPGTGGGGGAEGAPGGRAFTQPQAYAPPSHGPRPRGGGAGGAGGEGGEPARPAKKKTRRGHRAPQGPNLDPGRHLRAMAADLGPSAAYGADLDDDDQGPFAPRVSRAGFLEEGAIRAARCASAGVPPVRPDGAPV